MFNWEHFLWVAAGVAVSIILPLIRPLLPSPQAQVLAKKKGLSFWERFCDWATKVWRVARPYVVTGIFSLIISLLVLAYFGENLKTWQAAFLAGYAFDSTLQKITTGNRAPSE